MLGLGFLEGHSSGLKLCFRGYFAKLRRKKDNPNKSPDPSSPVSPTFMDQQTPIQEYNDRLASSTNPYKPNPKFLGTFGNPVGLSLDLPRSAVVAETAELRSLPETPPSIESAPYSGFPSLASQVDQIQPRVLSNVRVAEPKEGAVTLEATGLTAPTTSRRNHFLTRCGGRRGKERRAQRQVEQAKRFSMAQRLSRQPNPMSRRNIQQDMPSTVSDVGNRFLFAKCLRCDTPFLKNSFSVIKHFTQMVDSTQTNLGLMTPYLKCSSVRCALVEPACVGCGLKSKTTSAGETLSARLCCDAGRLFLIWGLLCGLEHPVTGPNGASPLKKKSTISCIPTPAKALPNPSGVGYGDNKPVAPSPNYQKAKEIEAKMIQRYAQLFRMLAFILPSTSANRLASFDYNPPETLREMLRYSPIPGRIAEFLRSDSIEFMCTQETLYSSLFGLLKVLGQHPNTASILREDLCVLQPCHSLISLSATDAVPSIAELQKKGTSDSLLKLLRPIHRQANSFLQHARSPSAKTSKDFRTMEGARVILLCQKIQDVPFVQQVAEGLSGPGTRLHDGLAGKEDLKDAAAEFVAYHKENAILDAPDDEILSSYSLADLAEATSKEPLAEGRMKRLIGEITALQTSLPSGIFVRHGASRLDVMKVMITGPVGTPYENGLFEFDLHCPAQYPNEPPVLLFKTTGASPHSRGVRFNPNLYENGSVCLSLLGTWSGEPWRPQQSTLLQVFVSIQSMIFCPEPWYNEPGRERKEKQEELSADHNSQIRYFTVKHALLGWLGVTRRADLSAELVWGDVVQQHFKAHGAGILQTTRRWAEGNNGKIDSNINSLLKSLETGLEKLSKE